MAVWLKGNEIKEPNGLFFDRGRLIVGNSGDGKLKAVSIPDKKIHVIAEGLNMIDGIDGDGNGNFIISDWVGRTSLITPDGKVLTLLDTSASKINSADLEYIVEKKLLILTTFSDNRLMAYEIK
jgi:sugar lactone lactonase YvrE